jgi:hypothetical protein
MTFLEPTIMQTSFHHLNHLFMMYDDLLMFFHTIFGIPYGIEYFKWNVEPTKHPI